MNKATRLKDLFKDLTDDELINKMAGMGAGINAIASEVADRNSKGLMLEGYLLKQMAMVMKMMIDAGNTCLDSHMELAKKLKEDSK